MRQLKTNMLASVIQVLLQTKGADETWRAYERDVRDVIHHEIVEYPFDDKEQCLVWETIMKKLDWVLMDHHAVHYQHPLPLLVPDVIIGLIKCVEMVPNALVEVSHSLYIVWFRQMPAVRLLSNGGLQFNWNSWYQMGHVVLAFVVMVQPWLNGG